MVACHPLSAQTPAAGVESSTPPEQKGADRSIELVTRFIPETGLRAGEPVTFEVVVGWLDLGETLSTRLAESPSFENFEVVSTSTRSSSHSTLEGRRMEEVYSFRLVPLEEGPARAGEVEVLYGPRGEEEARLLSVPLDVTVRTPKRSLGFLMPTVGAVVVVVLTGGWLLFKRRSPHVEETVQPESLSAAEEALTEARRWRMEGNISRYYGCLERAVGREMAKRYSYRETVLLSAAELPAEVDSETRRLIESFFSRCAEAKYAPGTPPREELDRIWDDANHLLRSP